VVPPIVFCPKLSYCRFMKHFLWLSFSLCTAVSITTSSVHAGKLIGAPVRLSPSTFAHCPVDEKAAKYFREAQKRGIACDIDGSIECYNQVLKLDPQNSSAYEARGTALLIKRKFQKAIDDFDKSISINPKNYSSYWGRGAAKNSLGEKHGALKDFDAAIKLCPTDYSFYMSRGDVRLDLGNTHGALEDAQRAISLAPKNAWTYYRRSRLLARTGDRTGAIRDLDMAGKLNSRFESSQIPRYIPSH